MKFLQLVKSLFRSRRDFVFNENLAASNFDSIKDSFKGEVPECLKNLYSLGQPKAIFGDRYYCFEKSFDSESIEYVVRFIPVCWENQQALADVANVDVFRYIVFAVDDFGNVYTMETLQDSEKVFFVDLEDSSADPFEVSDSLPKLISNLKPLKK